MNSTPIKTIDDVISILDFIIEDSLNTNNTLGYFAVLYHKVTVKVKEGIQNNFFEDGNRMEKLDIVFAQRYIDAWYAWKENQKVTKSWEIAFTLSENEKILVFQHLLLGMNAHINLDLGIAAAEISTKENIQELKNDFNKINEILSSLVDEVQFGLSSIWPALKWILSKSGKLDNYLIDFSMEIARDGAWNFATDISRINPEKWPNEITTRDYKIFAKSKLITEPGKWIKILFWLIRLGERGSVSEKMKKLQSVPTKIQTSKN